MGIFLLAGAVACAHARQGIGDGLGNDHGPRVVTAEAIEKSGAQTVWDALSRTIPFYVFHSNGRIEHRGRTSLVLTDQPLLILDGVTLNDVTVLTGMPASSVWMIEVMDGIDATTYYGTNAGQGAIRIWTKAGDN